MRSLSLRFIGPLVLVWLGGTITSVAEARGPFEQLRDRAREVAGDIQDRVEESLGQEVSEPATHRGTEEYRVGRSEGETARVVDAAEGGAPAIAQSNTQQSDASDAIAIFSAELDSLDPAMSAAEFEAAVAQLQYSFREGRNRGWTHPSGRIAGRSERAIFWDVPAQSMDRQRLIDRFMDRFGDPTTCAPDRHHCSWLYEEAGTFRSVIVSTTNPAIGFLVRLKFAEAPQEAVDCGKRPTIEVEIPNGAAATRDEMEAARVALQATTKTVHEYASHCPGGYAQGEQRLAQLTEEYNEEVRAFREARQ